jgi:predicted RNase H-like HicB family nuclease
MKKIVVTVEIWKEGNMFTSYCPELDVASCGHTAEEAKKNLVEVIEIQLEETAKLGTLKSFLEEAGYTLEEDMLKTEKRLIDFKEISIPVEM